MYEGFINPNASDEVIYDHYRYVMRKLPRSVAKKQMDRHVKAVQIVAKQRNKMPVEIQEIVSNGRRSNL